MFFRGNLVKIMIITMLCALIFSGCSGSKQKKIEPDTYTTIDNNKNNMYRSDGEKEKQFESSFLDCSINPNCSISTDCSNTSYVMARKYISNNQCVPKETVKIEEFINYFKYSYSPPKKNEYFSICSEVSTCPWNSENMLALIGVRTKKIDTQKMPPRNLVFLIDTSGSMSANDKLPLIKDTFRFLVQKLRKQDKVSIVTYSGADNVKLNNVNGNEKEKIIGIVDKLSAKGATAGIKGMETAYKIAKNNFAKNYLNSVVLMADGEFDLSDENEISEIIEQKKDEDIFLSVVGFGSDNVKNFGMNSMAKKGMGSYAYIDNYDEAKKFAENVFDNYMLIVATDTQLEVEFDKSQIVEYRVVGYEDNAKEEINAEKNKNLSYMYSDQTFTVLYEIKCKPNVKLNEKMFTVRLKYKTSDKKHTDGTIKKSKIDRIQIKKPTDNFSLATSSAEFGLILKKSKFKGDSTLKQILEFLNKCEDKSLKNDKNAFVNLVKKYEKIN